MAKLQNLFGALESMDIFQMTQIEFIGIFVTTF